MLYLTVPKTAKYHPDSCSYLVVSMQGQTENTASLRTRENTLIRSVLLNIMSLHDKENFQSSSVKSKQNTPLFALNFLCLSFLGILNNCTKATS